MYEREIEPNTVEECRNKEEWTKLMGNPTIRHGEWEGPGYYAKFSYSQPCSRGCCYDGVTELVPLREQMDKLKEHIRELAGSLKYYREINKKYDLLAKYTEE